MKALGVVVLALGAALLAGCSGDKGKGSFETAQFEEKQNNRAHAVQLYEEIVRNYPGSEYGKKAAARLAELKKPQ
jgi:outer membrane protein assembly factor BamD (BamD/ComL family)